MANPSSLPSAIFTSSKVKNVILWRGSPDCSITENVLESHVRAAHTPRLPAGSHLSTRQVGNLGEALAYLVTEFHDGSDYVCETINAFRPLSDESSTGVDLTWFHFDSTDFANDFAIVQEVKTSGQSSPAYAATLKADVDKLFGSKPSLRLETRMQFWAFRLDRMFRGRSIRSRVLALGAARPAALKRVMLRLTYVHDLAQSQVAQALIRVEDHAITKAGWPSGQISCWGIGVTGLDAVLARVATE